jgi:hypothetical protein
MGDSLTKRVEKPPAYLWYPKDYEMDEAVKLMSYEQEGIYRRLLDHQALHGSIPADPKQIAMLAPKVPHQRFLRLWDGIRDKFAADGSGRLINDKLARTQGEYSTYLAGKSAAGQRGAQQRWQLDSTPDGTPDGNAVTDPVANGWPPLALALPSAIDPPSGDLPQTPVGGFDAFWRVYPRKVGKSDARKVWQKLAPDAALEAVILAAVEQHKQSRQWRKDGGDYIPHPATWLNRGRWEDELPSAAQKQLVTDKTHENIANQSEALRLIEQGAYGHQR